MFENIFNRYKQIISNIPGWSTSRKFLVIESDDWGSIRMPSAEVFKALQKKGYHPETDPYLAFDSLESETDLKDLFSVLGSVRDMHGHPAVFTANVVVANPDFGKIRESDFSDYFYESVIETFSRYPGCANSYGLWLQGERQQVFHPQFHGREHLNVRQWMKGLQQKDPLLREAFDLNMISISSLPCPLPYWYMEGLDYYDSGEQKEKAGILSDGMNLFESLLGYRSESFIANCYIWDREIEKKLSELGVSYLQGIRNQLLPVNENGKHYYKYLRHFTGRRNKFGQFYLVRNAFYEPALTNEYDDSAEDCLNRVGIAFRWNKPAIIGTHRLNYTGGIHPQNRKKNLAGLKNLLDSIVNKWPEVEFISSDQLGRLIRSELPEQ